MGFEKAFIEFNQKIYRIWKSISRIVHGNASKFNRNPMMIKGNPLSLLRKFIEFGKDSKVF